MELPHEWREFIDLLLSNRVRFVVVGAHALAALGRPRATQDIDLLVEPTPENARRLCSALQAFGFTTLAGEREAFATPDRMATLGTPPLRIDVMTSISGVTFDEAWAGRVRTNVGGRSIGFLGRAEFVKNKRASGRTKDLLDIALLEESAPPGRAKRRAASRKRRR